LAGVHVTNPAAPI